MKTQSIKLGNIPDSINAVIEISQNSSPVKYEFDPISESLVVDRFLPVSMFYPVNYGFIPNTIAEDGDALDILVYSRFPISAPSIIACKVIGVLKMEDEKGIDPKILAVPAKKVDQFFDHILTYKDLSVHLLDSISHFFARYKDLEQGKRSTIKGFSGVEEAISLITEARDKSESLF